MSKSNGYGSPIEKLIIPSYGFQIHDGLSGSMHDHIFNFKLDFDILGTANTMELVEVVPATVQYPWAKSKSRAVSISRTNFNASDQRRVIR